MTAPEGRRTERVRLLLAALVGMVVGLAVATVAPWQLAVLAGWDSCALVHLGWTWLRIGRLDGPATEVHANREDDSRETSRLLLSGAATISLVGVALGLVKAAHCAGALAVLLTVMPVVTVVVSWALVHTLFTLRYADLYYYGSPGGLEFCNEEHPDYLDFAYVAFTVGMTFQVADTNIHDRAIRRTVLKQSLLSYVFGTVIIAVTINVIAGFVR